MRASTVFLSLGWAFILVGLATSLWGLVTWSTESLVFAVFIVAGAFVGLAGGIEKVREDSRDRRH